MQSRRTVVTSVLSRKQGAIGAVSAAVLISLLVACGAEPVSRLGSDDALGYRGRDRVVTPPKAYYDSLLADRMQLANSGALAKAQDPVLWINLLVPQ